MWARILTFMAGSLFCLVMQYAIGIVCGETQSTPLIDTTKPESWDKAVNNALGNLDNISNHLISIIEDKKRSDDDRRSAILLLGKIATDKGVEYLLSHITIRIPLRIREGDRDILMETPCVYALYFSENWNLVPAIFKAITARKDDRELIKYETLLRTMLTPNRALALVEYELKSKPIIDEIYKKNLETLRRYLQG